MKLEKRFPGKRIIITGAGSGLGRALALEFAAMKWKVAIAEINQKSMHETALLVARAGGEPLEIQCDVSSPKDLEKARSVLEKKWGGVDILVNNAGVVSAGWFERIPPEKWDWIININLKGVIYGCRAFIPLFKEQGNGHILNIGSSAGIASLPEFGGYNVTKAAVISVSETLRSELASHNIGVSVACPTFFPTNLMNGAYTSDERQKVLANKFFENSLSTADKVARHMIKGIKKNRMYHVKQIDGKFIWFSKRYFPELYFKVLAFVYTRNLFASYLGVSREELEA